MTVKITKPEINVREQLNELKKPTGVAGEAMLRADSVQEQRNLIGAGRKNLLINGDMQVWQRSTQAIPTSLGYDAVDRFWYYIPSRTSGYIERSTDVPADTAFAYSLHQNTNAGGSVAYSLELPATGISILKPNADYTYSFWAKGLGDIALTFRYRQAQGSGTNQVVLGTDRTIVTTAQWERHSITFNTGSTVPTSACNQLVLEMSGVDAGMKITGVQLELGSVATDFEHRSYGEELALCQRYCYVIGHPSQVIYLGTGSMYTSTAVNLSVPLPVQLRSTSPSFTRVPNGTGNWLNVYVGATGTVSNSAPLQGDYSQSNLRIYIPSAHSGSSPSAAGAGVWSMVLAGAQLIIDAEL